MSEFNQANCYKVVLHPLIRKDKTHTIYLRVIINKIKKEINLGITWPKVFFDPEKQICLSRHPKDAELDGVNMVINEAKGRANRINMRYFADNKRLTLVLFLAEFENYESRDNFLLYWKNKQNDLCNKSIITPETMVNHNTNLNRLIEFNKGSDMLVMADVNAQFVEQYGKWLRKKKNLAHNTTVTTLKKLLTYIKHAMADGHKLGITTFKPGRYIAGDRDALDRDEINALKKLLEEADLNSIEREVLRKFLFSCYTGIRISDSSHVHRKDIIDNKTLRFETQKGFNSGKTVSIPLPDFALKLIDGRKGFLFETVNDQICNRWLKVIAAKTEIKKRLTFHVSRDTFATIFIEIGGDVATLKDLLSHSDVATTMIYVKMSEKRKEILMANFNDI